MPLNYSKWDQLELSDDSDIEGHPNVDKRSLIRWKQRDIHQKREQRKDHIAHLRAQIACNVVLLPRLRSIYTSLSSPSPDSPSPSVYFNTLVEQLVKNPSRDCPPGNDPSKREQTYDGMVGDLLRQVGETAKKEGAGDEEKLGKALARELEVHVKRLGETVEKDEKELEREEKEQKKHITSDDLHEGFENKYVPPKPEPPAVPVTKIDKSKKTKTEIEVLNPKVASSDQAPTGAAPSEEDQEPAEEEDDTLPELTPSLEAFSRLPLRGYEKSFEFIQSHRDVVVPGASDALLVAAFRAQSNDETLYAKQCVHQSLLLQYCEKLGGDGVRVFFKKMMTGDKRAEKVFLDDLEGTYAHLVKRVQVSFEESQSGQEQIQLVPENPNQSITFNVPSGPPPEEIVLEGPGTEGMNLNEVRKALQFRWDVFQGFPEEMQQALKGGTLEEVNRVLGEMDVSVAEQVVQNLDLAGILSFAEGGIRDETGKGKGEDPEEVE